MSSETEKRKFIESAYAVLEGDASFEGIYNKRQDY